MLAQLTNTNTAPAPEENPDFADAFEAALAVHHERDREYRRLLDVMCGDGSTPEGTAASRAHTDSFVALMQTPPATLAQLVQKYRTWFHDREGMDGQDVESPDLIANALSTDDWWEETGIAMLLRDLIRLTDPEHPQARAEGFDFNAWLDSFLELPNCEISETGIALIEDDGQLNPEGQRRFLALSQWQRRLVQAEARHRVAMAKVKKEREAEPKPSLDFTTPGSPYFNQEAADAWDKVLAVCESYRELNARLAAEVRGKAPAAE